MLVKFKEKDSKLGTIPKERSIVELLDKGFLLIDKDAGPTSHESTDNAKKILGIEKAGHSGTLDPKVTGVLLVGLGRATRLMEYMLLSDKEYVCLMYVHKEITEKDIEKAFKKFTGTIKQTPPLISAVKRQERERTIYEIKLLDFKEGKNVLFKVRCQHGTYIRKLCSDIGEFLGVGAHMKELRRTKAGPFTEDEQLISLDKLRNLYELYTESKGKEKEVFEKELRHYLRPMEELLSIFKKVVVRDSAVNSLSHGSDLAIPGVAKLEENIEMGDEVALLTMKGELIGMGTAYLSSENVMKKKKGAFVKTNKIFMEAGTYPETWEFEKESLDNS